MTRKQKAKLAHHYEILKSETGYRGVAYLGNRQYIVMCEHADKQAAVADIRIYNAMRCDK